MSILHCSKCGVTEKTSMDKGVKNKHMIDNGGGWGRIKLIGNCQHCNYIYAVLFHAYDMDNEEDVSYVNYYVSSDRYKDMIDQYEKDKQKLFNSEYNKLIKKFNMES